MKKVQSFFGKRLGQVEGLHHYVMLSGVPARSVFDPSATTMTTFDIKEMLWHCALTPL